MKEKKPRTDNEVPSCSYSSSDSQEARENPGSDTIPYGTLVVFGYYYFYTVHCSVLSVSKIHRPFATFVSES